jgi:uncharacterized protein YyaL (SSP411 family)
MSSGTTSNRLIHEKSPYLLQHAHNPVDWYPWGEEAFAKARADNKPVFLSIGYSTCYWCHVMEREVFENPEIARLMNERLVNIKVDREERPDIDRIYMTAVQAITGSGGWPMSVFMTPEREPFFGGTYIPPQARYGRPGFPDLVKHISDLWANDRSKVTESSRQIAEFLRGQANTQLAADVDETVPAATFERLRSSYDTAFAGFGTGPKFPRPSTFNFLLRYHALTGAPAALGMTLETLRQMARGGMADHLSGGFHRYSVDGQWRVPHFEKMLYDQAQLATSYTEAFQATHDPLFARVVHETLSYVLAHLRHPEGGFYSAEDAESAADPSRPEEKEEGTFYLWTAAEIDAILGPDSGAIFRYAFGVEEAGNALHDPMGIFVGRNILYAAHTPAETAAAFQSSPDAVAAMLATARSALEAARARRPRPHLDDKIITAWNGLMISALAKAAQAFDSAAYQAAAEAAAAFVLDRLCDRDAKTLHRRYRDGEARFDAGLQDYAFLIAGLIDLYEATFDERWMSAAVELSERQIAGFRDEAAGGFFDTPGTDPTLLARTKEDYDGAEPTGNAVAALNFLRLGAMLGRDDYAGLGAATVRAFGARLNTMPDAAVQMAAAELWLRSSPAEIVLAGRPGSAATREMLRAIHGFFLPHKVLLLVDGRAKSLLTDHNTFLAGLPVPADGTTVYLCEHYACQAPTSDPAAVRRLLEARTQPPTTPHP